MMSTRPRSPNWLVLGASARYTAVAAAASATRRGSRIAPDRAPPRERRAQSRRFLSRGPVRDVVSGCVPVTGYLGVRRAIDEVKLPQAALCFRDAYRTFRAASTTP